MANIILGELLAPAGDINIFKSVINAGADAVYFGGDLFSARAFAKNFSKEDAQAAISYAHLHGKKAYLTVNTLLKNREMEDALYEFLKPYAYAGLDAAIVADMGVFEFIKYHFPDIELHASTQFTICSDKGARFFAEKGATRVVLARELSLDEIAKVHRENPELEIEHFCHGALCMCYSGQCLMSSLIGGRSGNRGTCAQPCRLNYTLSDINGISVKAAGDYLLSPKDFCAIRDLRKMLEAGVYSFKIEGRMKQERYATGVVALYRKYLDMAQNGDYEVTEDDYNNLLNLGNRSGFTNSYLYKHNDANMMAIKSPGHTNGEVNLPEYKGEKKIPVKAVIKAVTGEPMEITVNGVTKYGPIIEVAGKVPTTKEAVIKAFGQLGDTEFSLETIDVKISDNAFVPASVVKNLRREVIEEVRADIFTEPVHKVADYKSADNSSRKIDGKLGDINKPLIVSVKTKEQFDFVSSNTVTDAICVPVDLVGLNWDTTKIIIGSLPAVIRNRSQYITSIDFNQFDYIMAGSFDGLEILREAGYPEDRVILDNRLYTFSGRSKLAYEAMGYALDTISYELNIGELKERDNSRSIMPLYGYIPLMLTANCVVNNTKGCNKSGEINYLNDRQKEHFPVVCDCKNCMNIIYNCKPYVGFSEMKDINKIDAYGYRIDFTFETADEMAAVFDMYDRCVINDERMTLDNTMTKGHLRRGV